jgi:alkyl sulfatase BDS1-like metallo-beta-lactamase superfamily hydrolase
MMQQTTLAKQIQQGKAQLEGEVMPLVKLASTLVEFDPVFEIMPGTRN